MALIHNYIIIGKQPPPFPIFDFLHCIFNGFNQWEIDLISHFHSHVCYIDLIPGPFSPLILFHHGL